MAKVFSVVYRKKEVKERNSAKLSRVVNDLKQQFSDHPVKMFEDEISLTVIVGHYDELQANETKGLFGFTEEGDWSAENRYADGNYFIFRRFQNYLELITDLACTRTIWYFADEEYFAFSSMQVPLINMIGDFKFNKKVTPWMISSGTLGPANAWDSRISHLSRNTALRYHFSDGSITTTPSFVSQTVVPKGDLKEFLSGELKESVTDMKIHKDSTGHLLSGGIESRLLLLFLALPNRLPVFTWATTNSQSDSTSDVYVAKQLAKKFDLDHTVFLLDENKTAPEKIFDLFIRYGEGRVDHITGYMDGFSLWNSFIKKGIHTVVRGDQNFGRYLSTAEKLSRKMMGCELLSDFDNAPSAYTSVIQEEPDWMKKGEGESVIDYTARLGITYRHQFIMSALNDLKLCFVEINNPLLNNRLFDISMKIPPEMIVNKTLTRSINDSMIPDIPYARSASIESINVVLEREFKGFLLNRFSGMKSDDWASLGLVPEKVQSLIKRLSVSKKKSGFSWKSLFSKKFKKYFLRYKKNNLADIRILFRIAILAEMNNRFQSLNK